MITHGAHIRKVETRNDLQICGWRCSITTILWMSQMLPGIDKGGTNTRLAANMRGVRQESI
jgi:hypothetical protein